MSNCLTLSIVRLVYSILYVFYLTFDTERERPTCTFFRAQDCVIKLFSMQDVVTDDYIFSLFFPFFFSSLSRSLGVSRENLASPWFTQFVVSRQSA